jgi:hypothetical protein
MTQVDYGENGVLAWDPENATQLSRNTCADIKVEGRQWPKYKWRVTGGGFSLAQLTTTLPTNSRCTDSTACGPATIRNVFRMFI